MKQKITKKTNIGKVIMEHPETVEVFFKHNLHCIGCPASGFDTIEEGATMHGLTQEEIDKMVEEINNILTQN